MKSLLLIVAVSFYSSALASWVIETRNFIAGERELYQWLFHTDPIMKTWDFPVENFDFSDTNTVHEVEFAPLRARSLAVEIVFDYKDIVACVGRHMRYYKNLKRLMGGAAMRISVLHCSDGKKIDDVICSDFKTRLLYESDTVVCSCSPGFYVGNFPWLYKDRIRVCVRLLRPPAFNLPTANVKFRVTECPTLE